MLWLRGEGNHNHKILDIKVPQGKLIGASTLETAAIDSGACDSIAHPRSFPHTDLYHTNETGTQYGACGGNAVTNMGSKNVRFVSENGQYFTIIPGS